MTYVLVILYCVGQSCQSVPHPAFGRASWGSLLECDLAGHEVLEMLDTVMGDLAPKWWLCYVKPSETGL